MAEGLWCRSLFAWPRIACMTSNNQTQSATAAAGQMKLYKVPSNAKIRVNNIVLNFERIDGAYGVCFDNDGNEARLPTWIEVELLK